ncbi:hypothetical protein M8J76_015992 [Diaphorina citri]|nr:hypothetical protein M8J75_010171 [Diaphorina citri]KAI5724138.1 hypothetical protein M8J76_015992 [Diaphorina citri]
MDISVRSELVTLVDTGHPARNFLLINSGSVEARDWLWGETCLGDLSGVSDHNIGKVGLSPNDPSLNLLVWSLVVNSDR